MEPVIKHRFLGVFTTLLFLNFFVSVHYATTLYVNSSFLGEFFSPQGVSILYIVSSLFVMFMLANAAHIVEKIGVWKPYVITAFLLQLTVLTLGFLKDPTLVIIFFIAQGILVFVLSYFLDLYLESLQRTEGTTGNVRSMYITAGNIGIFLGPLVISVVLIGTHFAPVYIFAAIALVPVILIALFPLRGITPHAPTHTSFVEAFNDVRCCRENVRGVMVVNLVMHLFNSVIAIYAPLYLFEVGGMSWQAIGSLTALALVPYLFLEIPLGFIADRVWGEKELMIIGLSILGVSLILLTITPLSLFLVWSIWFITTRIGGAIVEITTESYFFKQVDEKEASLIGTFRMLSPLGRVIAPSLALIILAFGSLQSLFAVFGVIVLGGIFFAFRLVDTR